MTTRTAHRSSWIQSVAFKRVGNRTWLAVFIADEHAPTSPGYGTIPVAMLYGDVPSYLPGLLTAGIGGTSIGRAYNRLVKGRYPYQRIEGKERIAELRQLMASNVDQLAKGPSPVWVCLPQYGTRCPRCHRKAGISTAKCALCNPHVEGRERVQELRALMSEAS